MQLDTVHYKEKPKSDISRIKPRTAKTEPLNISAEDFADAVCSGVSFAPGILRGGARAENWVSQQLFAVDIDNEDKTAPKGTKCCAAQPLTVEEVQRRCSEWEISPFLIYETFSSSDEWQKFRIVFASDRIITDGEQRDRIQRSFMELFPECDVSCKNRDRLFFGGKSRLFFDADSSFDPEAVLPLARAAEQTEQAERELDKLSKHSGRDRELDELKNGFDLLGYIEQNYSCKQKRSGRYVILNPCPVCGHKDDFVYYPATRSFKCFGASGDVGGTVIDFLMHTKSLNRAQAIKYLKEDICGIRPKTAQVPHPKPEPVSEQYRHLFDEDGELLTDKLTADDLISCEAIYSRIYELNSRTKIDGYIMKLGQAAKAFGLAGDVKTRANSYKAQALRLLKEQQKSQHREQTGQTARDLKSFPYIIEHETDSGDLYYTVSCPLLADFIRQNCRYIITHDRFSEYDRIFWYEGGVYKPITDSELQGYIKSYITAFDLAILKMRDVSEVMKDLKTDMRFIDESRLNADEDIINFKNGLYSISQGKLLPHSPECLSTIQIPCNYDPNSKACPTFISYINTLADGRGDKAELLLEYMAACISGINGYRLKKALFMYGRGDTGKSQAKALTELLLGSANCAAGDLADLEERFGTSSLYQKRLYGSGDMSFVSVKELKIFKNVTGGDDIFLEFKGKPAIRYKYKGLLWFCTNELPSFGGDRGEWVYNRIIPFECRNIIPIDKQDKHLLEKMYAEREAIISSMLMPALQNLVNRGYSFDIPGDITADLDAYRDRNSPVRTFYKECCEWRNNTYSDNMTAAKLFKVFKAWYEANVGKYCNYSAKTFKGELAELLGVTDIKALEVRRNNGRFLPFTVNNETRENYEYIM